VAGFFCGCGQWRRIVWRPTHPADGCYLPPGPDAIVYCADLIGHERTAFDDVQSRRGHDKHLGGQVVVAFHAYLLYVNMP